MSDLPSLGYIPDPPDARDYNLMALLAPYGAALPLRVSYREQMTPVKHQDGLGACHDELTEVLTKDGWKLFKELTGNELLASVDPTTQTLVYSPIKTLIAYQYEGIMLNIQHKSLNALVTPNHNMLVRKWNETARTLNSNYTLIEAQNLGWYAGLLTEVGYEGKSSSSYTIKGTRRGVSSTLEVPMTEWLEFLGMYLADGTIVIPTKSSSYVQIAAKRPWKRHRVEQCLDKLGFHYTSYVDRYRISSKLLVDELIALDLYKKTATKKSVPDFVFQLAPELISAFLSGLMFDGTFDGNRRIFYTSSKQMADQIQILLLLAGSWSRVSARTGRVSQINGRIIQGGTQYEIHERLQSLSISRKKDVTEQLYRGMVYCAEVEPYHTLITRRNGFMLISGNCVAFAAGAMKEYYDTREYGKTMDLSEQWLYCKCKAIDGYAGEGTYPRAACDVLLKQGICEEKFWPYEARYPASTKPLVGADLNAAQYKILSYAYVSANLVAVKTALAQNGPLLIAIQVWRNFYSIGPNGLISSPTGDYIGGHAMCVVGYDDDKQMLEIKNSWGVDFGDSGYVWLPYSLFDRLTMGNLCSFVDVVGLAKRWKDWPDEALVEQDIVHRKGVFEGYPDGTIRPWEPLTRRHVALVRHRLGYTVDSKLLNDYTPATREWTREVFPNLQWNSENWSEPLTRFQFIILLAREIAVSGAII